MQPYIFLPLHYVKKIKQTKQNKTKQKQLNTIATLIYMKGGYYLDIVAGLIVLTFTSIMLIVTSQFPTALLEKLEKSSIGTFIFTFRGRYLMDVFASIILLAMGDLGVVAALLTCAMLLIIRTTSIRYPDAYNELFREESY